MTLSDAAENALINLLYNNNNWANVGDATGLRGSASAGSLYISLHTADPGETGTQSTSEAAYTGYARVAVARTAGGFTCTADTASTAAAVTFPACTGGSATVTLNDNDTTTSSGGNLIASGALTASLAVSNGITPSFAIGSLTSTAS